MIRAIVAKRRCAPRNNYLLIVLDSCRFDSFVAAAPRTILRLGPLERRWSYASWTAPSHYNLLMGLLPHASPPHVYASEYYKRDFAKYTERLGVDGGGVQGAAAVAVSADVPASSSSAIGRTRWSRCRCSTRRRRSTATSTPSR